MGAVKRNVIANFFGSSWSALMSLVFMPLYVKLMGVESYGIVGVYTFLLSALAFLDMGLSQTMNREMARLSTEENKAQLMADTARTLEAVYWLIALVAGGLIAALSGPIAYHWLRPQALSRESLQQAILIIAMVIALRWPVAIYLGGLNGLQKQGRVNAIKAFFATIQGGGAVLILWKVAPTIQAFFLWQGLVALLMMLVLRSVLWHSLPCKKGSFRKDVLRGIWRFAAGITGVSILATLLTQIDKLILSRMLTLHQFGYYTFAAAVAAVLYRITGPIFTAYYPRLTELVHTKSEGLIRQYHAGSQLMAVALLPVSLLLCFYSKEILQLWTRNPDIVEHAGLLVSLLALGNLLNGIMHMPYALQLAHGWTRLAFYQNVVAVIILIPAIYFSTLVWGAAGAAGTWAVLNAGYLLISVQIMHKRLLVTEMRHWYVNDVGKIVMAVLLIVGGMRATDWLAGGEQVFKLIVIFSAGVLAAVFSSGIIRGLVLHKEFVGKS